MQPRSDEDRLNLYRESLATAWGYVDYNDWPIKLNSVFHLFLEPFGAELLGDLDALEIDGRMSRAQIAALFYNPARIYRLIDSAVYSLRRGNAPLAEQRRQVLRLLDLVRYLKAGSEFNEDGRNIVLGQDELNELATSKADIMQPSADEARCVHRFAGIMWSYTESIFFRAHDVTKEIHGPYPLEGGKRQLLVREYLNLRPIEIWPSTPLLPCDTIRLYFVYADNIRLKIDALNHLYAEGGNVADGLEGWAGTVDGRPLTIEKLRALSDSAQDAILENTEKIDALSMREKIEKYAEIFWFRKSPLRIARRLPWALPESVRRTIAQGDVNPRRTDRLSKEQVLRLAKLTI